MIQAVDRGPQNVYFSAMFIWSELKKPILALAPMADMTDSAYCRCLRQYSPDVIVFREMVSAEALVRGNAKTWGMAAFRPEERPIVQQIFGSDPAAMAEAARLIDEKLSPDAIDINMGCPAHKIVGGFNGAALMRQPELAAAIVRSVKAATTRPVSVKTRLGWSEPAEILEFIKVLEDAGADLVSIHGRTKEQGYAGKADWPMIGRARELVRLPVLANGDIDSGPAAAAALRATGCAGVMIGRGALGNPWIFAEVGAVLAGTDHAVPGLGALLETIRRHARWHAAAAGGDQPLVTFRKHLGWYFKGRAGAKNIRTRLVRVSTLDELETLLAELAE